MQSQVWIKKRGLNPTPPHGKSYSQFCEYRGILIARINCMFNYKYVEVLQIFLNNTNVPVDNLLLFSKDQTGMTIRNTFLTSFFKMLLN